MNVDFSEIQSHVLLGFRDQWQALVFFRIDEPETFRAKLPWFEQRLSWTDETKALPLERKLSETKSALSLSFRGLSKLIAPADLAFVAQAPPAGYDSVYRNPSGRSAFAEDCHARANGVLMDDRDDLQNWVVGAPHNAPDGVLIVGVPDPSGARSLSLSEHVTEKDPRIAEAIAPFVSQLAGCTQLRVEVGDRWDEREHFGFRDGLSYTSVDVEDPSRPDLKLEAPQNSCQLYPGEALLLTAGAHPAQPPAAPMPAWLEGSSFLVFRRLEQDVPRFHQAILDAATQTQEDVTEVATRVLGRSPSGNSLILTKKRPSEPPSEPKKPSDDFTYADDAKGDACPFSAHVRRANPRSDPRSARPVFRRSIPYGPRSTSSFASPVFEEPPVDRGLLFLCYQASIERQFEYVTRHWLNNHDSFPSPLDALLGKQAGKPGIRDIDLGLGQSVQLGHYVRATGGGYFLTPSRKALRHIAGAGSPH